MLALVSGSVPNNELREKSMRRATFVGLSVVLIGSLARPAFAQVTELQVAPATITLTVGEQQTFLATAYDQRGNPVVAADIRWISTNLDVVQVEWDQGNPSVVTVRATGMGVAQVEARSGRVRGTTVIQVMAAEQAPPTIEPVTPETELSPDVSSAALGHVVRIERQAFGIPSSCRFGSFVDQDLVLTSYRAIRGGSSIAIVLSNGRRATNIARVAAYDVQSDLAVLHVPVQHQGAVAVGSNPTADQRVWTLGEAGCGEPQALSAAATGRADSVAGRTLLSESLGQGVEGAPVISRVGQLVAMATGGSAIRPVSQIAGLVTQARRNLGVGSTPSVDEVAQRERHTYGSVELQSELFAARARVTPMEPWHWQGLTQEASLPMTFAGPIGRYEVELLSGGEVQNSVTVTLRSGVSQQIALAPRVVADEQDVELAPPPEETQITSRGGGGFPVAAVVVGLLAVGGGAAFLASRSGGGDDGGGNGPPPPPTTGGIRIVINVP
ncbi:MAG: trypsin-like peptidase domain-containing protein [Planctomycetota bacterium]|jgi:hypothetical protein